MTKIQADAYITAYSTLEEHVFIAPCVVTTNDNWMGRTEKRFGNIKGPTIRRGARIGGGAILCPAGRDRRGRLRRCRCGRDEGRPAAGRRRRLPRPCPARRPRGRVARRIETRVLARLRDARADTRPRRRSSRERAGCTSPRPAHDRRARSLSGGSPVAVPPADFASTVSVPGRHRPSAGRTGAPDTDVTEMRSPA